MIHRRRGAPGHDGGPLSREEKRDIVRPMLQKASQIGITAFLVALGTACGDDGGASTDTSIAGPTSGVPSETTAGPVDTDAPTGPGTGGATTSDGTGPSTTAGTTAGETGATGETGETGQTSEGTGGATTGDELAEDEALLRAAIAGEVDPAEALETIAARGGLPVETADGGFLFACLCGPESWSLAGDHDDWTGAPMEKTGAMSWIELEIAAPDGSLYKFTDGVDQWIADPLGRRHGYDDFGRYSLVRASAAHLERWYAIAGYGLAPRDLEILVPDDGVFDRALYMHDGQNLFDPESIWGGWKLLESAPPGVLLIGVENTPDRVDEYTHVVDDIGGGPIGGLGDDYADLVELVVRPLVEEAYGEVELVGVMGSSLGGLISFHIADRFPERYVMAISMSGTMGWGSIDPDQPPGLTMIDRYLAAGHRATALYLDSGGEGACFDGDGDGIEDDGDDADNYCVNLQLHAALQSVGYADGVDVFHWHEPGAPHNELAWAERVGIPFELFASL